MIKTQMSSFKNIWKYKINIVINENMNLLIHRVTNWWLLNFNTGIASARDAQDGEVQFLFSTTLAQTFNNRSSRLVPVAIGRYRQQCYEWKVAKSRHRKIYINLKQIVHSLNLRSPLFRIDWCGNYCLSPRRTFHSSRRSGGILVLFCYRKRTRPPRLWAEWNYICLVTPSKRKFVFACGKEYLILFSWWKSIQNIKKERCFHRTGQNTWPAVLSSPRSGIVVHWI